MATNGAQELPLSLPIRPAVLKRPVPLSCARSGFDAQTAHPRPLVGDLLLGELAHTEPEE